MSRRRALSAAQERYVCKAFVLRRKLTTKALARRLGCSPATISDYGNGRHEANRASKGRR